MSWSLILNIVREGDYLTCGMEYIICKPTILDKVTHVVESKGNKGTNTVIPI